MTSFPALSLTFGADRDARRERRAAQAATRLAAHNATVAGFDAVLFNETLGLHANAVIGGRENDGEVNDKSNENSDESDNENELKEKKAGDHQAFAVNAVYMENESEKRILLARIFQLLLVKENQQLLYRYLATQVDEEEGVMYRALHPGHARARQAESANAAAKKHSKEADDHHDNWDFLKASTTAFHKMTKKLLRTRESDDGDDDNNGSTFEESDEGEFSDDEEDEEADEGSYASDEHGSDTASFSSRRTNNNNNNQSAAVVRRTASAHTAGSRRRKSPSVAGSAARSRASTAFTKMTKRDASNNNSEARTSVGRNNLMVGNKPVLPQELQMHAILYDKSRLDKQIQKSNILQLIPPRLVLEILSVVDSTTQRRIVGARALVDALVEEKEALLDDIEDVNESRDEQIKTFEKQHKHRQTQRKSEREHKLQRYHNAQSFHHQSRGDSSPLVQQLDEEDAFQLAIQQEEEEEALDSFNEELETLRTELKEVQLKLDAAKQKLHQVEDDIRAIIALDLKDAFKARQQQQQLPFAPSEDVSEVPSSMPTPGATSASKPQTALLATSGNHINSVNRRDVGKGRVSVANAQLNVKAAELQVQEDKAASLQSFFDHQDTLVVTAALFQNEVFRYRPLLSNAYETVVAFFGNLATLDAQCRSIEFEEEPDARRIISKMQSDLAQDLFSKSVRRSLMEFTLREKHRKEKEMAERVEVNLRSSESAQQHQITMANLRDKTAEQQQAEAEKQVARTKLEYALSTAEGFFERDIPSQLRVLKELATTGPRYALKEAQHRLNAEVVEPYTKSVVNSREDQLDALESKIAAIGAALSLVGERNNRIARQQTTSPSVAVKCPSWVLTERLISFYKLRHRFWSKTKKFLDIEAFTKAADPSRHSDRSKMLEHLSKCKLHDVSSSAENHKNVESFLSQPQTIFELLFDVSMNEATKKHSSEVLGLLQLNKAFDGHEDYSEDELNEMSYRVKASEYDALRFHLGLSSFDQLSELSMFGNGMFAGMNPNGGLASSAACASGPFGTDPSRFLISSFLEQFTPSDSLVRQFLVNATFVSRVVPTSFDPFMFSQCDMLLRTMFSALCRVTSTSLTMKDCSYPVVVTATQFVVDNVAAVFPQFSTLGASKQTHLSSFDANAARRLFSEVNNGAKGSRKSNVTTRHFAFEQFAKMILTALTAMFEVEDLSNNRPSPQNLPQASPLYVVYRLLRHMIVPSWHSDFIPWIAGVVRKDLGLPIPSEINDKTFDENAMNEMPVNRASEARQRVVSDSSALAKYPSGFILRPILTAAIVEAKPFRTTILRYIHIFRTLLENEGIEDVSLAVAHSVKQVRYTSNELLRRAIFYWANGTGTGVADNSQTMERLALQGLEATESLLCTSVGMAHLIKPFNNDGDGAMSVNIPTAPIDAAACYLLDIFPDIKVARHVVTEWLLKSIGELFVAEGAHSNSTNRFSQLIGYTSDIFAEFNFEIVQAKAQQQTQHTNSTGTQQEALDTRIQNSLSAVLKAVVDGCSITTSSNYPSYASDIVAYLGTDLPLSLAVVISCVLSWVEDEGLRSGAFKYSRREVVMAFCHVSR